MIRKSLSEKKRGKSPGSLIFTGEKKVDESKITVYRYDANFFDETKISNPAELVAFKDSEYFTWIRIKGLHEVDKIEKIGEIFNIHPLVLEDILNVNGIIKTEDYDDYLFLVAKHTEFKSFEEEFVFEQLSFLLRSRCLITFQERDTDILEVIIDRLKNNKGRIRKLKADYLMYRILDTLVDNYSAILENFDDHLEKVEDDLLKNPESSPLEPIHRLRKKIINIRRVVVPMRDAVNSIDRERSPLFDRSTFIFLRDLLDHIRKNVDTTDSIREAINGMFEINLSYANQKMNEVVKLLTVISAIFIPLTFIVGIYGMNFRPEAGSLNMPETTWKYGYVTIMGIMLLISVALIYFFKKKKWF